jgi:hypothetical protein
MACVKGNSVSNEDCLSFRKIMYILSNLKFCNLIIIKPFRVRYLENKNKEPSCILTGKRSLLAS